MSRRAQPTEAGIVKKKPVAGLKEQKAPIYERIRPNLSWDKNEAVVRYTLGPHQEKKIFASRYKLHLPTEAELKTEIRRELEILRGGGINH